MNPYLKNLDRIEFVVTTACSGRCKHCSQGDHTGRTDIDAAAAADAVRAICSRYEIRSLMTFGGEPLLCPETVFAIHRAAAEMDIPRRDLITNGFFSADSSRIAEVARKLKESGVTRVLLSVDAFHQETIPLEPVLHFARCGKDAGLNIVLSPAWLVSREDDNPYNLRTRQVLDAFSELDIPVGQGNIVFPSGNALKYLSDYFPDGKGPADPYIEDPRDVRAVSFCADGDVLNGNIYEKDILDILKDYHP